MLGSKGPGVGAVLLLAAAVAVLVFGGGDGEDPTEGGPSSALAPVTHVVDGDTVRALVRGEEESVRYIGIDTPELEADTGAECFGREASARNRELVAGERVRLVFGAERRDHYGRLLAYVYANGEMVNARLVEGGYARTLEIEPNTDRAELLGRLERAAARGGRGLWGACEP